MILIFRKDCKNDRYDVVQLGELSNTPWPLKYLMVLETLMIVYIWFWRYTYWVERHF
jgi:hypothetical protein